MTYSHELVINLLLLCLKLHFIRKRLPFASSADTEMTAERFESMFRRLNHSEDEAFHVILFLFSDFDVYNVSRDSKLHEKHGAVNSGNCFAFGSN